MDGVHLEQWDAMQTTFSLRFRGDSKPEAAGISRECFDLLEYLESRLSRYREGSDIWQINHLKQGEELFISEDCHRCLLLAAQAYEETAGRFDVTIGSRIEDEKRGSTPRPLKGALRIDPDRPRIVCEAEGREFDLGGIGKGYALDRLRTLLADWGTENVLLSAGASTHLASGSNPWVIRLEDHAEGQALDLCGKAISSSGSTIQGVHIFSSDGTIAMSPYKRVWAIHSSAALADAWSTALLLFSSEEFALHQPKPEVSYALSSDGLQQLG